MKNCYLERSGFIPTVFDGSPNNHKGLCELFGFIPVSEWVIAVEAIVIGSHLTVQATGEADGFMLV
jgi:hypothetical protein